MPDLKSTIENHPVSVLVGVCVVAAGCAAGTVGWFWQKSTELNEQRFQQKIALLESENRDEVADLKQRLISIGRRIGGDTLYVDVSKFPITSVEVPSLPASYERVANGNYFVSSPKFSRWTEQTASQLDLVTAILGDSVAQALLSAPGGLGNVVSEKTGVLWISDEVVDVSLPESSPFRSAGVVETLHLKPFVFVLPVDEQLIKRTFKAAGELFATMDEGYSNGGETTQAQELVETLISQDPASNSAAEAASMGVGQNSSSHQIEELLDALGGIYKADVASFFLTDLVASNFQMALLTGGTYRLVAAEKKGNVFYLRTHIVFPGSSEGGKAAIFDQEFFFVGTPTGGLLVRIGVPSTDLRSDAYAWTQAWITSLRVTID